MKIISWKQALKNGSISGAISFLVYIIFVFIISYLTDMETFINYDYQLKKINMLSFDDVIIAGVMLSAAVPCVTLRYQKLKYIFLYILSGVVLFTFLYCISWVILFLIYSISGEIFYCPLNTFDALYYVALVFPSGSGIGTLFAILINLIKNKALEN